MPLLEIDALSVHAESFDGPTELVHEISLSVDAGETLCVVGESGSGKTVTALSIIRLLEFVTPVTTSGRIGLGDVDLAALPERDMRHLRGKRVAMIFQEALESLNPSQRIGRQLVEAYNAHHGLSKRASEAPGARNRAELKAASLLREVGLDDTERILALYPHQLSGGMQQRVMIAMALMTDPDLLLADEPTTALDVTTQAEILQLFKRLQTQHRMGCIFITHDMGVAATIADRIAVMYGGRLVEVGTARDMLTHPQHPYTRALLECVPRVGVRRTGGLPSISGSVPSPAEAFPGCRFAPRCPAATDRCVEIAPALEPGEPTEVACWNPVSGDRVLSTPPSMDAAAPPLDETPALRTTSLTKIFRARGGRRRASSHLAVDEVGFTVRRGEFFGLVGESGSGKTTLGRMLAGLERPTSGTAEFTHGTSLTPKGIQGDHHSFRRSVQIVFQDPQSSLDPRYTVAAIIKEPLTALTSLRGRRLDDRVLELLNEVGLPATAAQKRTSQLSGGQRQRVAIARALAPEPSLIIADEPTSALDVSVQGQVMNLLLALQKSRGLSFFFITHNLSLVLSIADRIAVMHQGSFVQVGTPEDLLRPDAHEYTRLLLAANPDVTDVSA